MSMVENAGSVFLGRYASEPLGDYVGGTKTTYYLRVVLQNSRPHLVCTIS